jgi:hypothetical protein
VLWCGVLSLQTATLRILIGMALVALQNFSAGLDYDTALLAGTSSSSSSTAAADTGTNGNGASSSAAAAAAAAGEEPAAGNGAEQQQQAAAAAAAAVEPLTGDMQLAVLFRSQKKQLLLDVIAGLAEKVKQVCAQWHGMFCQCCCWCCCTAWCMPRYQDT